MPPHRLDLAANANSTTGWCESDLAALEQAAQNVACANSHNALGLVNVTEAAHLGSDVGQLLLGKAFAKGLYGLSKDPVRARFWLEKTDWEEAKELLQELGQ